MRKILCITACALALCSCAVRKELSILHLNDTHSHHEALRTDPPKGGIIERAAIIDSVRNARGPQNVLLLHAGATGAMAWLSAKIYKVGILMFGKKSTFKDLWKWLRMK